MEVQIIGSWVNIPYYKVINEEKDITFNPRIYADDKFILQSEYGKLWKSKLVSDFSLNNDGKIRILIYSQNWWKSKF